MDTSTFTDASSGKLTQVRFNQKPYDDWAFVPDPLPPGWKFDQRLWPLLTEAREQLGLLEGSATSLPDPSLFIRPLQMREAIRSSALEGIFATGEEMVLFDLAPERARDEAKEVANYRTALSNGYAHVLEGRRVNLVFVRQLHEQLLRGTPGEKYSPGEFRTGQNFIGSDRKFIPPPVEHLPSCLEDLERSFKDGPPDWGFDALVSAYIIHYHLEAIHPFWDGNGRVGRLLLSLLTYQWSGVLTVPWLYMSPYFDRYRDEYVQNLFDVSARGDWTTWIEFCLRGTVIQAKDAVRRCRELLALRDALREKVAGGPARMVMIVDSLFQTPAISARMITEQHGVTPPTAHNDIKKLVDLGIVKPSEKTSNPRIYMQYDVLDILHGEVPTEG